MHSAHCVCRERPNWHRTALRGHDGRMADNPPMGAGNISRSVVGGHVPGIPDQSITFRHHNNNRPSQVFDPGGSKPSTIQIS
jgi:hypothetical protein